MTFNVDHIIERLKQHQTPTESEIRELTALTKQVLVSETNLTSLSSPCVIVGDLHGISGPCPDFNYVFLGDYVDRGYYSVETISLLVCLKLRYPSRFFSFLRKRYVDSGKPREPHCDTGTFCLHKTYGFYAECEKKYGNANVWSLFTDLFDFLVLGAVIDDAILCIHGGIGPCLHSLDQIRVLDRFQEIPYEGIHSDLVWSDPMPSGDLSTDDFAVSPRGAGYLFSGNATRKFLDSNHLLHISRAHQLCMDGFQVLFDDLLSTVWSAPNYCYRAGNMASVCQVGPSLSRTFHIFGPCDDKYRNFPGQKTGVKGLRSVFDEEGGDLGEKATDLLPHMTSDFTIHNIPFGIISYDEKEPRCATAFLENAVDLSILAENGVFSAIPNFDPSPTLNAFMALGRPVWQAARSAIIAHLKTGSTLGFIPLSRVTMHLPCHIRDYTDFYASKEHATNVGTMFRGKENALPPNYLHLPIGYHGRASSVVVSGTPIKRPRGLVLGPVQPNGTKPVEFAASKKLDFELEIGFIVGVGNELGKPIPIEKTRDHVFGLVLLNDWSARDIQQFEYAPLGPFLGKNFGTSISPWIVTLDALDHFACPMPIQDPKPASYLTPSHEVAKNYDIKLSVELNGTTIATSNMKYMYWSIFQQLAHHTVNGCNMATGDLCGTGTLSGPLQNEFGSMLEISWNGTKPLETTKGPRAFLEDGDEVVLRGYCQTSLESGEIVRVGFGACQGLVLPALDL